MEPIKDNNNIQYQKEQDEILNNILYSTIYPNLQVLTKDAALKSQPGVTLELDITSACDKKCTYCYLQKYADGIYPKEYRSPDTIINNLKLLFDHFIEHNIVSLRCIDLFSGEIWGYPLGNNILDTIYSYLDKISMPFIMIPSNCSFVDDDNRLNIIKQYIKKFKLKNCRLCFSASYDGLIIDAETRPFSDKHRAYKEATEYADKLFNFCDEFGYAFHPMVDAYTIDKWVENFKWWDEQCKKYHFNCIRDVMYLEVRNPNSWNDTTISQYLDFLKIFKNKLKTLYSSHIDYVKDLFNTIPSDKSIISQMSYIPFCLREGYRSSCAITQNFSVRLGDLAIIPCHRTAYEKLLYGRYRVENNKIIGIQALNFTPIIPFLIIGQGAYIKCDTCCINKNCIKCCHGANYEDHKEILYPIESVCELETVKFMYVMESMIKDMQSLNNEDIKMIYINAAELINTYNKLKAEKKEIYEKWIPIVLSKI